MEKENNLRSEKPENIPLFWPYLQHCCKMCMQWRFQKQVKGHFQDQTVKNVYSVRKVLL